VCGLSERTRTLDFAGVTYNYLDTEAKQMSADLRIVIVGGQHVGHHAAQQLSEQGHDVIIIEKDPERVAFLSDQYEATVIQGDGGRKSILRQAGLDRTDVVAALTGYGAMTNIGICTVAMNIEPDLGTVARIDHGDRDEYAGLVDEVVYPEELAGHAATNEIIHVAGGGVQTVQQVTGDLTLVELTVSGDAPVADRELRNVSFPRGSVVVAGRDSNQLPGPEMVLEPGLRYLVAVKTNVSDEVVRLFRG
jgi:K+ transport systems, NAD-binding component